MTEPIEIALRVARALEAVGVEYRLERSLASSIHGEPRATNDVDLVIDLPPERVVQHRLPAALHEDRPVRLAARGLRALGDAAAPRGAGRGRGGDPLRQERRGCRPPEARVVSRRRSVSSTSSRRCAKARLSRVCSATRRFSSRLKGSSSRRRRRSWITAPRGMVTIATAKSEKAATGLVTKDAVQPPKL